MRRLPPTSTRLRIMDATGLPFRLRDKAKRQGDRTQSEFNGRPQNVQFSQARVGVQRSTAECLLHDKNSPETSGPPSRRRPFACFHHREYFHRYEEV